MTDQYLTILNNNPEFTDIVPDDLKCVICETILKDAHLAPCGCQFCKSCIFAYLSEEDKFCPGNLEECRIHLINFTNDIRVNPSTNRRIKSLSIKCIYDECEISCYLENMIEHIKCCDYKLQYCPFSKMGCDANQMSRLNVINHLSSQVLYHSNLLQQENDLIKNQQVINMNILNEYKEELTNKSVLLKEQIQSSITKIGELEREKEEMKEQIQSSETKIEDLETGMNERNLENEEMKEQIQSIMTKNGELEREKEEMKEQIQSSETKIGELKNEISRNEEQIQSSEAKIGELERKNQGMEEQSQSCLVEINKIKKERNETSSENKKLKEEIEGLRKETVEMKGQIESCLERSRKDADSTNLIDDNDNSSVRNVDEIPEEKWICKGCKYQNEYDKFACIKCDKAAPFIDKWRCETCTCINEKLGRICIACESRNENLVVCRSCHGNKVNKLCDEICDECLRNIDEEDEMKRRDSIELDCKVEESGNLDLANKTKENEKNESNICRSCNKIKCFGDTETCGDCYRSRRNSSNKDRLFQMSLKSGKLTSKCKECYKNQPPKNMLYCVTCSWFCTKPKCNTINYPGKDFCMSCGMKQDQIIKEGNTVDVMTKSGVKQMWCCTKCHTFNAGKPKCSSCGNVRYMPGYRKCRSCQWVNLSVDTKCKDCGGPL